MKTTLKTFMSLVGASLAAVSILTVSALAVSDGIEASSGGMERAPASDSWSESKQKINPGNYSDSYIAPKYCKIDINGGYDSGKASTTLTAKDGAKDHYKATTIMVVSSTGKSTFGSSAPSTSNNAAVSANTTYTTSDYPRRIFYYGYICKEAEYDATTGFLQQTTVNIYREGYASASVDDEATE